MGAIIINQMYRNVHLLNSNSLSILLIWSQYVLNVERLNVPDQQQMDHYQLNKLC